MKKKHIYDVYSETSSGKYKVWVGTIDADTKTEAEQALEAIKKMFNSTATITMVVRW